MSGESGAVVGRRSRAEIERLAGLYRTSGMGRSEFCRSHGMALSTLNRHLKKQQNRQNRAGSNGVEQSRLVAVELDGPVATVSAGEVAGVLTVLLSNRRRVEVGRGFDATTLTQLITVLERL
jgi:DNA-binding transcriptional ArsR family regulator